MNIAGFDLPQDSFEGADLRGADLQWAGLRGADLRGADLQRVNLREADLRGANLREANLQWADLRGADLRGADLDFSCWPLWCGSIGVKIDDRLMMQLLGHVAVVDAGEKWKPLQEQLKIGGHRRKELGF